MKSKCSSMASKYLNRFICAHCSAHSASLMPASSGDAQILSGGFTAEHGNYMSGVVDIATVRNNDDSVHELGVSFVSAFARSSGPIADGRGSYFVSARRGYLDLMADAVVDEGEELQPRYGDLFGRVSYSVNDKTELSAATLLSNDDVSFVDPGDGEDFGEDGSMQYFWLMADFERHPASRRARLLSPAQIDTDELGSQISPPVRSSSVRLTAISSSTACKRTGSSRETTAMSSNSVRATGICRRATITFSIQRGARVSSITVHPSLSNVT